MKDYFEIGPTPCSEDCAQVGSENFRLIASIEMEAYIDQLYRMFGEKIENSSISFGKKWFNHDFGSYGEVVVFYDDDDPNAHLIYEIERELPEFWDKEASKQISENLAKVLPKQNAEVT